MTQEQMQVRNWMIAYEQDAPPRPIEPSLETRKLRAKLIMEEALECIEALGCLVDDAYNIQPDIYGKMDLVKLADGLADLHYVAYCGTAVACGLDMEPIFAEVHRSNVNKFWTNTEIAKHWRADLQLITQTSIGNIYVDHVHIDKLTAKKVSKTHWLVKSSDGKVIKSPSWKSPDIAGAIAKGTLQ